MQLYKGLGFLQAGKGGGLKSKALADLLKAVVRLSSRLETDAKVIPGYSAQHWKAACDYCQVFDVCGCVASVQIDRSDPLSQVRLQLLHP